MQLTENKLIKALGAFDSVTRSWPCTPNCMRWLNSLFTHPELMIFWRYSGYGRLLPKTKEEKAMSPMFILLGNESAIHLSTTPSGKIRIVTYECEESQTHEVDDFEFDTVIESFMKFKKERENVKY